MRSFQESICLLAIVSIFAGMPAAPTAADEIVGRATVIDGDTIEIAGERIRLDGIDAPESRQHCMDERAQSMPAAAKPHMHSIGSLPARVRHAVFGTVMVDTGERSPPVFYRPE